MNSENTKLLKSIQFGVYFLLGIAIAMIFLGGK